MVLCGNINSYNKNPEDNVEPNVLSARTTHITLTHIRHSLTTLSLTRPSLHCVVRLAVCSGFDAIYKCVNIRGFIQGDYVDRYPEFYGEVPQLVEDGSIVYDETVYKGMDKIPEAFAGLFKGHNTGKSVVLIQ